MKNQAKTWNVKVMAVDGLPETTIEGVAQGDAVTIIRALMYGRESAEYAQVEAVVRASHDAQPITA